MNAWERMQARQRSAREAVQLRADARGVRQVTIKDVVWRIALSLEWYIAAALGLFIGALLDMLLHRAGATQAHTGFVCLAISWVLVVVINSRLRRRWRR